MAVAGVMAGCSNANLAERLGYPRDSRLLIIHADDLGTFKAVNSADIGMLPAGMVTSAAINVPGKDFEAMAKYLREHPELDVGVHITLSSEFRKTRMAPVSPPEDVRSLVDADGFFPPWIPKDADPKEVGIEIRAQIRKLVDAGVKPTHIDTHMGTAFATYGTTRAYLEAAAEFGLPAMALSPDSVRVKERIPSGFLLRGAGRAFYRWRVRGTPLLDELVADVGWDKEKRLAFRREKFIEAIKGLKPGVNQILIHPAVESDEMPSYDEWHFFTANRYQDRVIFTDAEVKKIIEAEGIKLIGWKPIRELGAR